MRTLAQNISNVEKRLLQSRMEAETLNERDLRCKLCGFKVFTVFSDIKGHFSIKCPKCKQQTVLNVAYFRRVRRSGTERTLIRKR